MTREEKECYILLAGMNFHSTTINNDKIFRIRRKSVDLYLLLDEAYLYLTESALPLRYSPKFGHNL
jgi:hypothetical protein